MVDRDDTLPDLPRGYHGPEFLAADDDDVRVLQTQFFQVRVAAAFDQRNLARLVHVHFQIVSAGRTLVSGRHRTVRVCPLRARRASPFPLRQRGGSHRRRPAVVVVTVARDRLTETAATEMPQFDAEFAFEFLLQHDSKTIS